MYQNSIDRISAIGQMVQDKISKDIFPIETNDRILYIDSIDKVTKSNVYEKSFNIKTHLDAKLKGRDLTIPIKATLVLKDKKTGKIIDRKKVTLMDQPVMTNRGTFIYGGNDYHMINQLRLKPGIYTRIKDNGQVESFFNLSKGGASGFSMWMNPESGQLKFKMGGKNPNLYAIMKSLNVSDKELETTWGKELLDINRLTGDKLDKEITKVYTNLYKGKAKSGASSEEMKEAIREFFNNTGLSEDTTKITLGKGFDKITPEALVKTSDKLIKVSKKEAEPDERDSLFFKNIFSVEDLLSARVSAKSREVQSKIKNNINSKDSIKDIYSKDYLNKPIRSFLTQSSLSTSSDQTNPVAMANAMTRTTLLGEGGISSLDIVTNSMRAVSNSHLGALDPSQTPESKRIGINLNLSNAAKVENKEIKTPLINMRTGKEETLSKLETYDKHVAFPDQYDKRTKQWRYPKIRVVYKGKFKEVSPSKVDYILRGPSDMFSISSNLTPFQSDIQGNRTMMANKMSGQAISLKDREAPLVQVKRENSYVDLAGNKIDTEEKAAAKIFAVRSTVDGIVVKKTEDFVEIKPDNGSKNIKIYKYNYFPMANKAYMHSEFKINPGDKVKRDQIIAEDNYTKDDTLALGTNLNIAYIPYKDKTFEDGFVISERAAEKLTSQHMYTYKTKIGAKDKSGAQAYMQQFPTSMTGEQQAKLDSNGVIKEGTEVHPGDTLVALLHYREPTETDIALGKLSKTLLSRYSDGGIKYDHDEIGKVERVVNSNGEITIHVSSARAATTGDKLVGRYGNKGVITDIRPTDEMPVSETGIIADIVTSPYGVPGRINVGQIYEPIAGKVAQKLGRPIKITNMDPSIKSNQEIKRLAKKHGIKTSEKLYDPKTGRMLTRTTIGPQYMYKLVHMVDKKMAGRGPYAAYNSDEQPAKGGGSSARAMDRLTWNGLIAHGARENLREMATYKANKNPELWNKIRLGLPIPAPKTPFSTEKLFSLMQAAGINVKKDGQQMMLTPMGDKETLNKSNGAIDDAQVMMAKTLRPIKDGLFDDSKTGGLNGKKWTHIELTEPVVSPIMAPAAQTVLGLTNKKFDSIATGAAYIHPVTKDISTEKIEGYMTGGAAIKRMLSDIDVKKEYNDLKKEAKELSGDKLDKANKKLRYLRALVETGSKPDEAYTVQNLPVLPPHMRPIYSLPDGSLSTSPINFLYRDLIMVNKELKTMKDLPDFTKKKLRSDLYKAAKAVQGLGNPIINRGEKKIIGALHTIKGDQPKEGFFQSVAFSKKQELSGQSTAAPSVDVSPDEVMLPRAMAWNMFEPFIHRELTRMGFSNMQAKQLIQNKDPKAAIAMDRVAEHRPVWVNRAPSLHKLNMLAMKPIIYEGSAIKVNPLIVGGYNLDFDGDSLGIYPPVSHAAIEESKRFMPSKVLDDPRDYGITLKPSHDMQLGLYAVTSKVKRKTHMKFNSLKEAEEAFLRNKIDLTDVVMIKGYETTFGREKLKEVLPKGVRIPENGVSKSDLNKFMRSVADADPSNVNTNFANMMRVAAEYNAASGIGLTLEDLESEKSVMDPIKNKIKTQMRKINNSTSSEDDRQNKKVEFLTGLISEFNEKGKNWLKANTWKNNLATMYTAAGKPGLDSVKQLKFAPLVVKNEKDELVPTPITRNYSEGVTSSDFWVAAAGARKGMIDRQLQTAEPGYFAKQMISVAADQVITEDDCGTNNGVTLDLTRDKMDVLWRYEHGTGILIDNRRYEELLRSGKKTVKVRSPITCEANEGICQKCYGSKPNGNPIEIGANVGTEAGQVATERTTQLTMKTFHTGSVATAGPSLASGFERLQQLSHFPSFVQDRATLAHTNGIITDIKENPAGGVNVWIGDEKHWCPVKQLKVKLGDKVSKGQPLSEGAIKPQELLATKGIRATQDYLIDEMQKTFTDQNVNLNRRAFETLVRATTNVTKVIDPKDSEDFLPGDKVQLTKVLAYNKMNPTNPITHEPELLGIDFSSKITDDWMAKMNTNRIQTVLQDAVASGGKSYTHSYNPVTPYVMGTEFGKGEKGKY